MALVAGTLSTTSIFDNRITISSGSDPSGASGTVTVDLYRSTTAGFTPSSDTKLASTVTLPYDDNFSFTTGTPPYPAQTVYYYAAVYTDASGATATSPVVSQAAALPALGSIVFTLGKSSLGVTLSAPLTGANNNNDGYNYRWGRAESLADLTAETGTFAWLPQAGTWIPDAGAQPVGYIPTWTDTSGTAGTTYYYVVQGGDQPADSYVAQTVSAAIVFPDENGNNGGSETALAIGTLGATETGTTTANVTLSADLSGGSGTGYAIALHRSTTSGFTPSTATLLTASATFPYADTGLTAATTYYYEAVGSDSTGATVSTAQAAVTTESVTPAPDAPTYAADNAAIYYSPANWLVASGVAKSVQVGAYFRFMFSGQSCTLNFDLTGIAADGCSLAIVVDGVAITYVQALTADVIVTAPDFDQSASSHVVEVTVKGVDKSKYTVWTEQQTAVVFKGVTTTGTIAASANMTKTLLFYGDSYGEGHFNLSAVANTGEDGRISVAMGFRNLGYEVGGLAVSGASMCAGYGDGLTPGMADYWDQLWENQPRVYNVAPDVIVINQASNDSGVSSDADYEAAYKAVIAAMLAKFPETKIVCMAGIDDTQATQIQAVVTAVNDSRVLYYRPGALFTGQDNIGGHPSAALLVGTLIPELCNGLAAVLPVTDTVVDIPGYVFS